MVASHLPTSGSSFLCIGPGSAAFIMASIAAFSSGQSDFFFLSSADTGNASNNTARTARSGFQLCMANHPLQKESEMLKDVGDNVPMSVAEIKAIADAFGKVSIENSRSSLPFECEQREFVGFPRARQ